jgi:hypothetical protein
MMKTRTILSLLVAFVASVLPLRAQQSLTIVDALPPYNLTANLLSNGHFSLSTTYTGTSKSIIYREDGTGNRPVNFTSHIHFKVDDVVFQLPFELNPATRENPPENPVKITQLFRDSLNGVARINARSIGILPDGDTVRFLFTMMPVKRPSGGFIRLSATVENSTKRPHSIGVLMLIDTKIGDNDQAPIVTSFGYRDRETGFTKTGASGMPEFWLALEGTPTNPGLTARGNLRASGLIEPDIFIFGNWTDFTAQNIRGLASSLWKERGPADLPYTDSAILLLWEEMMMGVGEKRVRASTEIGIVDSLDVEFGNGGGGGGGGALAGASGCLSVDTIPEAPCGDPAYHPYSPDTLQALYIVTNTGSQVLNNVKVTALNVPAGIVMAGPSGTVIPSTLDASVSGVATISFYVVPRLRTQTYMIPVAVTDDAGKLLLRDTICVIAPGLLGAIEVEPVRFEPLCPGSDEILEAVVKLDGVRCLPITNIQLLGAAPDIGFFSLVAPLPTIVPSNGEVRVKIRYAPGNAGTQHNVRLAVEVRDQEELVTGSPTIEFVRDTANVTGIGRDAEFFLANTTDTLDLGPVCVGDFKEGDWLVKNIGGCSVAVETFSFVGGRPGQFSLTDAASFPLNIARSKDDRITIRFSPNTPGMDQARLILTSPSRPGSDTLIVRGFGDTPRYALKAARQTTDTLCPDQSFSLPVRLENPSACPVVIDTLEMGAPRFNLSPRKGFTIPAGGAVTVQVTGSIPVAGDFPARLVVRSATGDQQVDFNVIVASRALATDATMAFGNVLLGQSLTQTLRIRSTGTAPTEISNIRIAGANASEFSYTLPAGVTFPHTLQPGEELAIDVTFVPGDLESRRASILVETTTGRACVVPAPIEIDGRGIQPVVDVPRRLIDLGRVCVGSSIDTVITIRNIGNEVLNIQEARIDGTSDVTLLDQLPVQVAVNGSRSVRVRFTPRSIGPIGSELHLKSDGRWLTAPDTLVMVHGDGIICGTLAVDTVRAATGSVASIPVRLIPAPGLDLSATQVADLMNAVSLRATAFTISHDRKILRFRSEQPAAGMFASPTVLSSVAVGPDSVHLSIGNSAGTIQGSDIVATLRADVLLGNDMRTPLKITLDSFASGYSRLELRDGLLIAEYCAIDQRYVDPSGVTAFLRPTCVPLCADGALELYLADDAIATLVLVDPMGRVAAMLHDGEITRGVTRFTVPDVDAGMYTAVLVVDGRRVTVPVIVVR